MKRLRLMPPGASPGARWTSAAAVLSVDLFLLMGDGPKTGITNAHEDGMQVEGGSDRQDGKSFVAVFSIDDGGDVPPRWTIGGPNGSPAKPRGIDLDPVHKTVIVSDKYLNAVLTYAVPEIYD
jgi:hypothetical protein